MTTALAQLAVSPLWIDDSGSATVTEIGAKARRLKRDRGLSLVIVDYLQLIAARGPLFESKRRSFQHHARTKSAGQGAQGSRAGA